MNYECSHCGYKFAPIDEEAIGPFCDCPRCGGLSVLEEEQAAPAEEGDPFALPDDDDDDFTGKTGAVPLTPGLFEGYFQEAGTPGGLAPGADAPAPSARVMRDEFEAGNIHREPTMLRAEAAAGPAPEEGASWGSLYETGDATPGQHDGQPVVSSPSAVTPHVDPLAFAQGSLDGASIPAAPEFGDQAAQLGLGDLPRPPGLDESTESGAVVPPIHDEQTQLPGGIDGYDDSEDYGDDVLAFDMEDGGEEEPAPARPATFDATAIEAPSGPAANLDEDTPPDGIAPSASGEWAVDEGASWVEPGAASPADFGIEQDAGWDDQGGDDDDRAVPMPIDLPVPPAGEDAAPLDFNSSTELDEEVEGADPFSSQGLPSPQDYETVHDKPVAQQGDGPTLPFASLLSGQMLIGGDQEPPQAGSAAESEGEYLEDDEELAEISDKMNVSDLAAADARSGDWVVAVPGAPPPLKPLGMGGVKSAAGEVSAPSFKLPDLQMPQETEEIRSRPAARAKGASAKGAVTAVPGEAAPPREPRLFSAGTVFGLIALSLLFLAGGAGAGFLLVMSQQRAAPISGPAKARALLGEANKLLDEGRAEEAVAVLEEARGNDPTLADVQRSLGVAYTKLGKEEKAAKAYRYYVRLAPGVEDAEEVREMLTKHLGHEP